MGRSDLLKVYSSVRLEFAEVGHRAKTFEDDGPVSAYYQELHEVSSLPPISIRPALRAAALTTGLKWTRASEMLNARALEAGAAMSSLVGPLSGSSSSASTRSSAAARSLVARVSTRAS